jgi:hypothetical protein
VERRTALRHPARLCPAPEAKYLWSYGADSREFGGMDHQAYVKDLAQVEPRVEQAWQQFGLFWRATAPGALESGVKIHNSMRVVPNSRGSEVIFMRFRQPDMSDEQFAEDAEWVEKDLRLLKDLLEKC